MARQKSSLTSCHFCSFPSIFYFWPSLSLDPASRNPRSSWSSLLPPPHIPRNSNPPPLTWREGRNAFCLMEWHKASWRAPPDGFWSWASSWKVGAEQQRGSPGVRLPLGAWAWQPAVWLTGDLIRPGVGWPRCNACWQRSTLQLPRLVAEAHTSLGPDADSHRGGASACVRWA